MSMVINTHNTKIPVVLDGSNAYSAGTLSGSQLTWHGFNGVGADQKVRATDFVAVGEKKYAEFTVDYLNNVWGTVVGVVDSSIDLTSDLNRIGQGNTYGISYNETHVTYNTSSSDTVTGVSQSDIIILAAYRIDSSDVQVFFGLNGTWFNSDDPDTLTGGWTVAVGNDAYIFIGAADDSQITANFGDSSFSYTVPSGFTAMSPE